ncbi:MAG: DUF1573 domain-containing protein [Planctomycetes bacterium]|nr:DUF1573 domain-containing protein [Planctomycetota bacterium]
MALRKPTPLAVALAAVVCGIGFGTGTAALVSRLQPWRVGEFDPLGEGVRGAEKSARVSVDATTHAFGTIALGNEGEHAFVIRNVGQAPLVLSKGASSCSCTVMDFDSRQGGNDEAEKAIAPGGSAEVRLKWRGKADGPFRQQATVLTNDPGRPEVVFVVEGAVVPSWRAVPSTLVISRATSGSGERATADLFTFGDTAPEIVSTTLLNSATERFFKVGVEPLPPETIAAEKGATGGVRLVVDVLPDAEIGLVKQTARVVLRTAEELTVEVPIEVSVSGALSLAGAGWDPDRQALALGTVSGKTGGRWDLFMAAKGPHRQAVRPVVREVVPSSLAVTIGEAVPIGNGNVMRIPITIELPAGSAPAVNNCTKQAPAGRIVLETGHPESPTMSIKVCVAITP